MAVECATDDAQVRLHRDRGRRACRPGNAFPDGKAQNRIRRRAMNAPTHGLVLAGGLARRMGGGDKALIRVGDETILSRTLARLTPQVEGVVLNANGDPVDRKSTRLNSSHLGISYAVFCLNK